MSMPLSLFKRGEKTVYNDVYFFLVKRVNFRKRILTWSHSSPVQQVENIPTQGTLQNQHKESN